MISIMIRTRFLHTRLKIIIIEIDRRPKRLFLSQSLTNGITKKRDRTVKRRKQKGSIVYFQLQMPIDE